MPQMISLISILRLVVIIFVHCRCSDAWLGDIATYEPMTEDQEFRVGSPIELTCSLKNHTIIDGKGEMHNVNASYLTFKYSNGSYVDAERIQVISPLESKMRIESSKVEDSGVYYCILNLGNETPIVYIGTVRVGYEPQKGSINFTCISNYQELECKWETEPSKLKTASTVKENIYYKLTSVEMYKRCAKLTSSRNNTTWSCKWTLSTVPSYDITKSEFEFIVETNNSLGKKSDRHHVNHYEIVLPSKPQQLVVHNRTQNWIQLNWLSPKDMDNFAPGLLYQIMYKPQQRVKWKVINITLNVGNIYYDITDLIPNTLYLVTLRCRSPYSKGENMWSENETLQIRTKPDVPYFAPNTTQQAFEIRQTRYSRTIIIHWEHVPEEYWNGEDFHYIISYHPARTKTEEKSASYSIIKNTTMPYATFHDLDSNSAYYFKIFSANSNGLSRNYSSITVDSSEKIPLAPEDITVILLSDGHYNISWKPPRIGSHLIKNYTLFWCNELRPRPFLCEGSIHWKHVTKTNVELIIPDEKTNFQFAVAASSEESISGMEWALCSVPYNGAPEKLRDFSVSAKNSTSLHITWKLDCSAQKAIIKEFSVYYCKADQQKRSCVGGYEINKITNNSAEDYYITNLVPNTVYRIYVEILSVGGQKVDSEYKYEQTSEGAPSDSPRDLKILNATNSTIEVSWKPPQHPNGIITRYVVLYNGIEDNLDVQNYNKIAYSAVVETKIMPFTNYSIQLKACVNKECSPPTNPVYVITDIGIPGEMDEPRAEAVNTSFVTVSWNAPLQPNGPISYYLLYFQPSKDYNATVKNVPYIRMINITGNVSSALVNVDCPIIGKGIKYSFQLQPVNELDNKQLFGPKSNPTTALACLLYPDGFSSEMIVSIIVGSAVGCAILLFIIYMFIRWMKKKYDLLRKIKVKLPTGLDTPNRGTPGTYQDFKKDILQSYPNVPQIKQNSGSFVVDIKKNRHGSGHSQYSNISADELLIKKSIRCDTYRRNPSGNSSSGCSSTGGHDSISSSNTHQTHVSTDSGTEFDFLHMSGKDNVFPEQASTHKHSIFMMPDLDSSPEKDELNETLKKHAACSSVAKNVPLLSPVCLQPYCKFGLNQVKDSYSNHCPRQWNMLTYVSNLANSEPSVAELDPGNSNSSLMPYSKVAFSKSLENLHETNVDYLKYGTIDDSVICGFENAVKLPCYTAINVYQHDRGTTNTNPLPTKGYVSIQMCLERKKMPDCNKLQSLNQNVNNAPSDSMAYSKFDIKPVGGLSVDLMENPKTAAGYIPLQQANCMLQTVDLSSVASCSPFDGSIEKELRVSDVSLPAEIVSAIIEPCAVNKLNVPDEHYNFHLYKSHSRSQEDITATGGNDGTEVDKNQNTTALNKKESIEQFCEQSCVSDDVHPQTINKYKENGEETKTNEQNSVSNNYLNGLEVVMSPSNLNCATTSLPACRFYSPSDEVDTNSKNGYVHISPVYYV